MRKLRDQLKFLNAQSATELAVFGAIIIFLIGAILRQSLGFNYSQNHGLAAMRLAMAQSFKYSQGLTSPDKSNGDASRNSGSVLIIEDRLTADSAKYGSLDRSPQIVVGQGTHSCNLFLPVEACEHYNVPVLDMYINGVYVALSTAKMVTVTLNNPSHPDWDPSCGCMRVWEKVPGPETLGLGFNAGDASRFDLDRNGSVDVPAPLRSKFSWQWRPVQALTGNIKVGDLYDVDGDMKEEQVMKVITAGGIVTNLIIQDYQAGDIDNTYDSADKRAGRQPSGLTRNTNLYAFTQRPNDATSPGTFLRIEEGKLFNNTNQIVRSVQRKDTIDLVSREILLANDPLYNNPPTRTHLFCLGPNGPKTNYAAASKEEKELSGYFHGMAQNPVEACGNCFSDNNYDKTCYETSNKTLYVRSRIQDRRGRKWITNIQGDAGKQPIFQR